ncbi:hypothetical protein pb186bvf_019609 [Paramecium bursaria]
MGSQSSKLVNDAQKHEHAINYMNSGGSMSDPQEIPPQVTKEVVNTVFKWNQGGQKVFVVGTFTQWKQSIQLQKDKQGEFSIVLPLEKGVHQYKFIVDGDWRFAPEDPTCTDEQGNINNVIDTQRMENRAKELMDSSTKFKPEKQPKEESYQSMVKQQSQEMVFSEKAPPVPPHLLKFYFIEEKEKKLQTLWNKEFNNTQNNGPQDPNGMEIEQEAPHLTQKETFDDLIQIFSNVNSLSPPQHVCLNHLACLNPNKNNSPYNVYAVTHRFKAKYTTIKFYTHKYQDNRQQLFVV